jgi:hypothetical protein
MKPASPSNMNLKEARNFSEDARKELDSYSFTDDVYLSIKNVGTKAFRHCSYDQLDGWLFIWTPTESFFVKESEMGDFLIIDAQLNATLI